jgi:hypothetical protein
MSVAAKDPPAPLDFLRGMFAVTPQKPVANQKTYAVTVRAMGLLQVAAASVKMVRVSHIRCRPMHESLPLCAHNPQPSSLPPGHAKSRPLRSVASLPHFGAGIFPHYHCLPALSYDGRYIPIAPVPTIPLWKSTGRLANQNQIVILGEVFEQ